MIYYFLNTKICLGDLMRLSDCHFDGQNYNTVTEFGDKIPKYIYRSL